MKINIGRYDLGEGPLTNLTDGGDGILNVSKETRNKISKSLTGKLKSEDHKKNLRKPKSEEQKIKQSIIMTGRQALFETKQLMSIIHSSENNFNNKWKYELSNGKNYFTFFTFNQRNIIRAKFSRKKSNIIVFKNVIITRIIKEVTNG